MSPPQYRGLRALHAVIPLFEKEAGYFVETIAVVSGQAITMGERELKVNHANWSTVNASAAEAFADFTVSTDAREIVRTFGVDEYGSPFFSLGAGKEVKE